MTNKKLVIEFLYDVSNKLINESKNRSINKDFLPSLFI